MEGLQLATKSIKVHRQLIRHPDKGLTLSPPKTKSSVRTIILGRITLQILREHDQNQHELQKSAKGNWVDQDLVFTENDGTSFHPRRLIEIFKALLQQAGLEEIRFHDLRHTAATQMIINGADILTASKRLGHSQPSTR